MIRTYIDKPDQAIQRIASAIGYTGRKFEVREATTFNPNNNHWSGGSRTYLYAIDRSTGAQIALPQRGTIFDPEAPNSVPIPNNVVIVEHVYFTGKDLGLRFLVRPDEIQTLIGAKEQGPTVSTMQFLVLAYTKSRVSNYGGKDRCAMAQYDATFMQRTVKPFTRSQWEDAKAELIAAGLLNKAGAITTAGKNTLETLSDRIDKTDAAIEQYRKEQQ